MEFYEGCLSVEGFQAIVPRARAVRVHALDHRGEPVVIDASGWYARILQHEIDHLNGTLYIDRMRSRTISTARNFSRYWAGVADRRGAGHAGENERDVTSAWPLLWLLAQAAAATAPASDAPGVAPAAAPPAAPAPPPRRASASPRRRRARCWSP